MKSNLLKSCVSFLTTRLGDLFLKVDHIWRLTQRVLVGSTKESRHHSREFTSPFIPNFFSESQHAPRNYYSYICLSFPVLCFGALKIFRKQNDLPRSKFLVLQDLNQTETSVPAISSHLN